MALNVEFKVQNEFSEVFDILYWLRQGDRLSTLLLEIAMRRTDIQTSKTLATNIMQILGVADDLDIASSPKLSYHIRKMRLFNSLFISDVRVY